MSSTIEEAGLGVAVVIPEDVSTESIWEALLVKIEKPFLMIPVTDVVTRVSDDGLGTYREMSLGPRRIVENIYVKKDIWEVIFKNVDGQTEVVNRISTSSDGVRSLEFFLRSSVTNERVYWAAPAAGGRDAILKTIEVARTSHA